MQVKVLGPLEAWQHGTSVAPTAAKPRQILAMLAFYPGQAVSVSTLIEELWGMHPPRSAMTTLQTYIRQLRRLMETALAADQRSAKNVLVTRCNGYLLAIDPEQVDVCVYDKLALAGSRAADMGDYESASRLLRSALEVWRGRVLVDVPAGMRLGIEVIRLEESKLNALERCVDAELRLGGHYRLLSELAMLSASYPMHENFCAQFMVALYRCGQLWRALEAFMKLRDTLVGELGVEPSNRLQELHRAILRSDPVLDESRVWSYSDEKLAM